MFRLLNNLQGYAQNGYAGNHLMMADEGDIGTMLGQAGGVTTAAAILAFNKAAVAPPTITLGYANKGSISVVFPEWTKLAVSVVTSLGSGSDAAEQANAAIGTTANELSVLRHSVAAQVSDLVAHGGKDDVLLNAGNTLGNVVAAEFDNHVCNLLDNLDTTVGSATTSMTFGVLMDAVANNEANDAPRPYSAILHPLQVFGTYGISGEVGQVASEQGSGALGNGIIAEGIRNAGFVTRIGGVDIYTSPQTVSTSDQHKGGCYAKTAIGAAVKDTGGGAFIQVESDRAVRQASTTIVANGYWNTVELVGTHGCVVHTETS